MLTADPKIPDRKLPGESGYNFARRRAEAVLEARRAES